MATEVVIESLIGNYYGGVAVKDDGGKCFMSVENYDGHHWTEVSRRLYDAFVAEFGEETAKP